MRPLLALALAALLTVGATEPAARATQVHYIMGTLWTVEAEGPRAEAAIGRAFEEIRRLDARWSTYKPNSELSRVNRDAARGWTRTDPETFDMLTRALGYARESGGAFDPTVGPLVALWGFKHLDYRKPEPAALAAARRRVGHDHVALDPARGVRFSRLGMSLDLGAIAKGYAVDRALEALRRAGMTAGRVDAGGNQGVFGDPQAGEIWRFAVKHPRDPEDLLGVVGLPAGAVSTSGDAERGFWHEGVRYGHILDPRTGQPARGLWSVTVTAPTAEAADALSTTLYVLGRRAGLDYLKRRHPAARALFVEAGGSPGRFEVHAQADLDWTPAPALNIYDDK